MLVMFAGWVLFGSNVAASLMSSLFFGTALYLLLD